MPASGQPADFVLSMDELNDRALRTRIASIVLGQVKVGQADGKAAEFAAASVGESHRDGQGPLIRIERARGQANALMAIRSAVRLHVIGSLGDYSLSLCSRCDVRIDGDGGHGVAECLEGAVVRVRGNVGHAVGVGMRGGATIAVYGNAGDRVGAAMLAGELFVRGDVGQDAGVGMRGGTLVVGGNAGPRLGEHRGNGIIYLKGRAESLAEGMVEVPLKKKDELRLGMLLINASIRAEAKDFRRVIPETMWRQEQSKSTGVMRPSWR